MSRAAIHEMLAAIRTPDVPAAADAIRIEVYKQQIRRSSAARTALGHDLTTLRQAVDELAPRGYRTTQVVESLLGSWLWPSWPTAGMAPIVVKLLRDRGIECPAATWWGGPTLLEPRSITARLGSPGVDYGLCVLAGHVANRLVEYSPGSIDIAWLITQVASVYPSSTLVVVTSTNALAARLARRLRRWIGGVTVASRAFPGEPGWRVLVGTFGGIAHHAGAFSRSHFLIFPDALTAIHERNTVLPLAEDSCFRCIGFISRDAHVSPYQRDRLVAMFGLPRYRLHRHGFDSREIRVLWMPLRSPRVRRVRTPAELIRAGCTRHHTRNRRLARVARALSAGDARAVREICPTASQVEGIDSGLRTLVLTASVDHACALARLLPDWPIVMGDPFLVHGLAPADAQALSCRRRASVAGGSYIATEAALLGIDFSTIDAVIWAGGGERGAPIRPEQLLVRWPIERRILLVDVTDEHHARLRAWARSRAAAYDDAEWLVPGDTPFQAAVRRFLAGRPLDREVRRCTT